MEPDFYRLFHDLPVPELVKVAQTPDDHLPEAVAVAQRILKERGISREEIAAEEWLLAQKEMADGLRRERRGNVREWASELFGQDKLSRFGGPGQQLYAVFLLLYCIFYLYMMYDSITTLAWFRGCTDCVAYPTFFVSYTAGFALYITAAIYLILRQQWMGWSLAIVQMVYLLSSMTATVLRSYAHHHMPYVTWRFYLFLVGYISAMIILLQPLMKATFKVNTTRQNRTWLTAILAGLIALLSL